MKYCWHSLKFLIKSWPIFLLVNIVPAIFLGLYTTPFNSIHFVAIYASSDIKSFADVLRIVFETDALSKVYPIVLIMSSVVVCMALGISIVDKYHRIGRVSLSKPLSGINAVLFPSIITFASALAAIVLTRIVLSSLVIITHLGISGVGVPSVPDVIIVGVISVVIILVGLGFFLAMFMWIPTMSITGYLFKDAAVYSIRLVYNDFWRLWGAIVVPFAILTIVTVGLSFALSNNAMTIVNIAVYVFMLAYIESFVINSYNKLRE